MKKKKLKKNNNDSKEYDYVPNLICVYIGQANKLMHNSTNHKNNCSDSIRPLKIRVMFIISPPLTLYLPELYSFFSEISCTTVLQWLTLQGKLYIRKRRIYFNWILTYCGYIYLYTHVDMYKYYIIYVYFNSELKLYYR